MSTIKASAVAYLNTKPLLYGLQKTGLLDQIDLSLDIPSNTAKKLLNGEVQLGLVPVAVLPLLPTNYRIVSNYCIGTERIVKTVCLYSQVPLRQIKRIYLDHHSRTSVQLLQLLCEKYWQLSVDFLPASEGYIQQIEGDTAGLIIGDRAIQYSSQFAYEYDLGIAWNDFTQLPFVFAAWVSIAPLSDAFIQQLNQAFQTGIAHVLQVATQYQPQYSPHFDVYQYLTKNIHYHLDKPKKKALSLFLNYLESKKQGRLSAYNC